MTKEIRVSPELTVPIPVDLTPQEAKTLYERAKAAFNTAEFLYANGLKPRPEDAQAAQRESAKQFTGNPTAKRRPFNAQTATWLNDLLDKYNNAIVEDTVRLKTYVTTRLVEESDPVSLGEKAGDRLRALESLGRLTQLGMFADKVEVSVNHKTTDELKQELAKKLSKYMGLAEEVPAQKTLEKPKEKKKTTVIDLDKELGTVKLDKITKDVDLDD
jgi:hypothetical protein